MRVKIFTLSRRLAFHLCLLFNLYSVVQEPENKWLGNPFKAAKPAGTIVRIDLLLCQTQTDYIKPTRYFRIFTGY